VVRPWSEVAQEEARTHIFADGKYVEPGDHPIEMSRRIEESSRWARRKAKTRANVGLMRSLARAVRVALRERKDHRERSLDL
jgi:hypothetical protein